MVALNSVDQVAQGTALAPPSEGRGLLTWAEMKEMATILVRSGFLPKAVNTAEKAIAVMQKGRELGIPPMLAVQQLYIVDGKAIAQGQLMLALAYRSGQLARFEVKDEPAACTVTVQRQGFAPVSISWSDAETKRAGLETKDSWRQYPRIMRRWRAITEVLRLTFPDFVGGLSTAEELGVSYEVKGGDLLPAPPPTQEVPEAGPEKAQELTREVHPGNWSHFWTEMRELRLTPEAVHGLAGVPSLKGLEPEHMEKLLHDLRAWPEFLKEAWAKTGKSISAMNAEAEELGLVDLSSPEYQTRCLHPETPAPDSTIPPQAGQPPLDLDEVEAAARQEAAEEFFGPADPPQAGQPRLALVANINELREAVGWTRQRLTEALQKRFGVATLGALSEEQLEQVRAGLSSLYHQRR